MIDLYFWPTPNGKKVTILLEEAGIPYNIKAINIRRGDQLTPDFLRISPNGRMPAIVDHEPIGGGAPISIFESGAIMVYLAEKIEKFLPREPHQKSDVMQWVFWQMANQGPKMGEQGHFRRASKDPKKGNQAYALLRFDNEVHRIYGVMNLGLHRKRYLAAGQYTIADMICYPWTLNWQGQGQDIEDFKYFKRWFEKMGAREAVQKGMAVTAGPVEDPANLSPEERERRMKLLFNQRARPAPVE